MLLRPITLGRFKAYVLAMSELAWNGWATFLKTAKRTLHVPLSDEKAVPHAPRATRLKEHLLRKPRGVSTTLAAIRG